MLPLSTALLLLNLQKAWDEPHWGSRNHPEAESRIQELLAAFRRSGRPVIHVRQDSPDPHSPLHAAEPGHAFKSGFEPLTGEAVLGASVYCAFSGTELEQFLRHRGLDRLVIVGFSAAHHVSSTVRMAADLGFKVLLVRDAVVSFELEDAEGKVMSPDEIHRVVLAELHGTFGAVLELASILPHLQG